MLYHNWRSLRASLVSDSIGIPYIAWTFPAEAGKVANLGSQTRPICFRSVTRLAWRFTRVGFSPSFARRLSSNVAYSYNVHAALKVRRKAARGRIRTSVFKLQKRSKLRTVLHHRATIVACWHAPLALSNTGNFVHLPLYDLSLSSTPLFSLLPF